MKQLHVAQVSPLYESVPPHGYGGTERVVAFLTDELVRQGHRVTLFASGDSVTGAELVAACPRALRTDPETPEPNPPHARLLEQVARRAAEFDVVHFHLDCLHLPVLPRIPVPHLTTLHGRLDRPETVRLWREHPDVPVVSISDAQRRPLPELDWRATVHHGLSAEGRPFRAEPDPDGYLLFLGRIAPDKRPDRALEIARESGLRLVLAAKVDRADRAYFEREIEPLLDAPGVRFVGEVRGEEKQRLLGGARALLFPIDWPEPFGLVMIEAFACGTPVIGWRCGSVPEIVSDGVDGFVVDDLDRAVAAVGRLAEIDRRACRRSFEQRFAAGRMAADYLDVYRRLLAGAAPRETVPREAVHGGEVVELRPAAAARSGGAAAAAAAAGIVGEPPAAAAGWGGDGGGRS